jgi:hypothetical protein
MGTHAGKTVMGNLIVVINSRAGHYASVIVLRHERIFVRRSRRGAKVSVYILAINRLWTHYVKQVARIDDFVHVKHLYLLMKTVRVPADHHRDSPAGR